MVRTQIRRSVRRSGSPSVSPNARHLDSTWMPADRQRPLGRDPDEQLHAAAVAWLRSLLTVAACRHPDDDVECSKLRDRLSDSGLALHGIQHGALVGGLRINGLTPLFSYEPDGSIPWRPDGVTARFVRLRDNDGRSETSRDSMDPGCARARVGAPDRHFCVAPDWSRRLRSCRCCLCRRCAPDSIHVSDGRVGQAMSARSP